MLENKNNFMNNNLMFLAIPGFILFLLFVIGRLLLLPSNIVTVFCSLIIISVSITVIINSYLILNIKKTTTYKGTKQYKKINLFRYRGDPDVKGTAAYILKHSISENNLYFELEYYSKHDEEKIFYKLLEHKALYFSDLSSERKAENEFANNLYRTALDVTHDLIEKIKFSQTSSLLCELSRVNNRTKQYRFGWERHIGIIKQENIIIKNEIIECQKTFNKVIDAYVHLTNVDALKLDFPEIRKNKLKDDLAQLKNMNIKD